MLQAGSVRALLAIETKTYSYCILIQLCSRGNPRFILNKCYSRFLPILSSKKIIW